MTDNILRSAMEWLTTVGRDHMADELTYTRGSGSNEVEVAFSAIRGNTTYEIDNGTGIFETFVAHDFVAKRSSLSAMGKPQPGDKVVEVLDGVTTIYEVVSPAPGVQCFSKDPHKLSLRIHTKVVSVEG